MDGLGATELLLIFIVILLIFGPEKLPEFARKIGTWYRKLNEYKRYLDEEIRKGYLEAEKMVKLDSKLDNKLDKLSFKRVDVVEKDEVYRELVETAKELGIDPTGKGKVELAREIREKLSEKSGVASDE